MSGLRGAGSVEPRDGRSAPTGGRGASGEVRGAPPGIVAVGVSFNAAATLERRPGSLEAARGELVEPLEVVVVDNGSRDGSRELVRQRFPRARLLTPAENGGFGAACNLGARASDAERILLLNPDAWLRPGALAALDERLRSRPRLGLVAPRLLYPDGGRQFGWAPPTSVLGEALQKLRNRFERSAWAHASWLRRFCFGAWFTGACLLVRRSAFASVAGFDERFFLYFEDVDFCRRLRKAGWRFAEVASAEGVHVKGGTAAPARELDYRRSQLLYYALHRPRWERRLLLARLRRKVTGLPADAPLRRLVETAGEFPRGPRDQRPSEPS